MDSREGDKAGLKDFRATRIFKVILRDDGDDINDPLTPLQQLYPLGQSHPESIFSGLVVNQYDKGERLDIDVWKSIVEYGMPIVVDSGITGGWILEFSTAIEIAERVNDLNGVPIGGNAYKLPGEEDAGPFFFSAATVDGEKELIQVPGAITPKTISAFKPVSHIVASKTVKNITTDQLIVATASVGMVNKKVFFGWNSDKVLLSGFNATPRVASDLTGQSSNLLPLNQSNIQWDLRLDFLIHLFGWQPVKLFDRFEWKGFEGQVFKPTPTGTEAVFREFTIYRQANFDDLLTFLGGATVKIGGPGPRGPRGGR